MKSILYTLFILLSSNLLAQIDRSVMPKPGKAPIININDSKVFKLPNGITVILSENHKIPKVSFDLRMGSDPILEGRLAGLSDLTGSLLLSGTTTKSKDQFDNDIDYIGADLSADKNSIFLSCLTKHVDKGLTLMSDVFLNASFPQEEFDRIKKQNESGLMAAKSDAGTMAQNAISKINFPQHPYGEVMTEASLNAIQLQDVKDYFKKTFTPNGAYLVIVGDVNLEEATRWANKYFGLWTGPESQLNPTKTTNNNNGDRVIFVNKPGAVQSVVYITFPVDIHPGDKNQLPLTVLNGIFGGGGFGTRLMHNLREDKAYTYGCYSRLNITDNGSWISAGGNFRNAVTDSAITEILNEFKIISSDLVKDDELDLIKSSMNGDFSRSLESPQTIARFAYNIIKNKLNLDYYKTYLQRLDAVSKESVLEMAKMYFNPYACNIIVVGNEEVLSKIKVFDADGQIEFLDAYGDEKKQILPSDISKEELVERYLSVVTMTKTAKERTKKLKKVKIYLIRTSPI
jgi:predicted Zn-dependent peptidase